MAGVNRIQGLHTYLTRLSGYSPSEFEPGARPGAVVGGIRHEDLTELSYADESFDVVLTSETLEHVPDLDAALREIHRVLVPGGHHIFTVPTLPGVVTTFARAALDSGGAIIHRAPPICHPGGEIGYLVFTEFGADLLEILQGAGFRHVAVAFGPATDDDVAQVYISRKSERPPTA